MFTNVNNRLSMTSGFGLAGWLLAKIHVAVLRKEVHLQITCLRRSYFSCGYRKKLQWRLRDTV